MALEPVSSKCLDDAVLAATCKVHPAEDTGSVSRAVIWALAVSWTRRLGGRGNGMGSGGIGVAVPSPRPCANPRSWTLIPAPVSRGPSRAGVLAGDCHRTRTVIYTATVARSVLWCSRPSALRRHTTRTKDRKSEGALPTASLRLFIPVTLRCCAHFWLHSWPPNLF